MKKVILKIEPDTNIVRDIGERYDAIPEGYIEYTGEYPSDITGGYYKFADNEIVKDEELYNEFIQEQLEQREQELSEEQVNMETEVNAEIDEDDAIPPEPVAYKPNPIEFVLGMMEGLKDEQD